MIYIWSGGETASPYTGEQPLKREITPAVTNGAWTKRNQETLCWNYSLQYNQHPVIFSSNRRNCPDALKDFFPQTSALSPSFPNSLFLGAVGPYRPSSSSWGDNSDLHDKPLHSKNICNFFIWVTETYSLFTPGLLLKQLFRIDTIRQEDLNLSQQRGEGTASPNRSNS